MPAVDAVRDSRTFAEVRPSRRMSIRSIPYPARNDKFARGAKALGRPPIRSG